MNKKVIVITGNSEGIGSSTALILHGLGHQVYGLSRRVKDGLPYPSFSVDVTDASLVAMAIQKIIGIEKRIDVLINNAGMGISGTIEDTTFEDAQKLFDVNFFGSFALIQSVLPIMRESGGGKIINISSLASSFPLPFQAFYSASKAALTSLSLALKNEVSPFGIDVCVILPGDIKTAFTQARQKSMTENKAYGNRVMKSIEYMEKDEQSGMDPKVIGHYIAKLIHKKRMPLVVTLGFKYKIMLFMEKVIPKHWTLFLIGKLYAFKKDNKR